MIQRCSFCEKPIRTKGCYAIKVRKGTWSDVYCSKDCADNDRVGPIFRGSKIIYLPNRRKEKP